MKNRLIAGVIAGATGTLALDIATYVDMTVRGRAASSATSDAAKRLAELAQVSLGNGENVENRATAIGALLGYATGISLGTAFGKIGRNGKGIGPGLALILGLAAMAAADVPLVALGVTDPRSWEWSDWLSDLIPHLIFGSTTAAALSFLSDPS